MKKGLLFLGSALVISLSLMSCKKDWVCSCTTTTTGMVNGTFTEDSTLVDLKKNDAETKCSSFESSGSVFGNTWDTNCALK